MNSEARLLTALQIGTRNALVFPPLPHRVSQQLGMEEGETLLILHRWVERGWLRYTKSPMLGWLTDAGMAATLTEGQPDGNLVDEAA